MHASHVSSTYPPLLNLLYLYIGGGVGGLFSFFYGSGRAITKGGIVELGGTGVLGGGTTNGGLLAIDPSQQQELQDGCLPHVNQV